MPKQTLSRRRLLPAGSLRSRQWNLPILESLSQDDQALAGFEELALPLQVGLLYETLGVALVVHKPAREVVK
jgi:hypothetical protein